MLKSETDEVPGRNRFKRLCAENSKPKCSAKCCMKCCLCCDVFWFIAIIVFASIPEIYIRVIGGVYGPELHASINSHIPDSLESGNWKSVEDLYQARFWLDESILIVGGNKNVTEQLTSKRGDLLGIDRKMPIASASKMVSASVIYCIMEDPLVNLTAASKPVDLFDWWNCEDLSDPRCKGLTIEKLLAFRSGIKQHPCAGDNARGTWENCAKDHFFQPYDKGRFDTFEYSQVGILISGLMALESKRKITEFENVTWQDLLEECIIKPSGILPASSYADIFENGNFTYDYKGFEPIDDGPILPDFPGLSGALSCSPLQYSLFLKALLSGEIISREGLRELTRNHGSTAPDIYSYISYFQGYAQGMWYAGDNVVHSTGVLGFFPWLDQSNSDPDKRNFGILAMNTQRHFEGFIAGVLAVVLTLTLGTGIYCAYKLKIKSKRL